MESGYQWRALPPRSDIAVTEIGYNSDVGEFGEQGGIAYLNGNTKLRAVAYGLAMAADGNNFARIEFGLAQQIRNRTGVAVSQNIANLSGP